MKDPAAAFFFQKERLENQFHWIMYRQKIFIYLNICFAWHTLSTPLNKKKKMRIFVCPLLIKKIYVQNWYNFLLHKLVRTSDSWRKRERIKYLPQNILFDSIYSILRPSRHLWYFKLRPSRPLILWTETFQTSDTLNWVLPDLWYFKLRPSRPLIL